VPLEEAAFGQDCYLNFVVRILTSFCSSGWGDCGGVITCSLHTSSDIPSSNGGGNGTVASGGTSTASCENQ